MKLPRHTATTSPPRASGLARASDIGALIRTGKEAKLRGIGAIGKTIGDIGGLLFSATMKRKKLDADLRWGKGTQKTKGATLELIAAARKTDYKADEPLPGSPDFYNELIQFSVEERDNRVAEDLAEYDNITGQIAQSFTNPNERAKYEDWRNADRLVFETNIKHEHSDKHGKYAEAELKELMLAAAQNGDLETANEIATIMDDNELITPEKARVYREQNADVVHKAVVDAAYAGALSILAVANEAGEDGLEAAKDWIAEPTNVEGLTGPEKYRLQQQMKYEEDYAVRRSDKEFEARTKQTISDLAVTYLEDDFVKQDDVDTLEHTELRERWTKIQEKQTPIPVTKDWRAVLDLQDTVIDYLLGDDWSLTDEEMTTQLIEGATANQQISEKELKSLTGMMKLKTELDVVDLKKLKASFDRIKKTGRVGWRDKDWTWTISKWVDSLRLSDSEAKQISSNRLAEIKRLLDRKGKKEDISLESVIKTGIEIDVAARKPTRTVYPEASPEMLEAARKVMAERVAKEAKGKFDPEGTGYDMESALEFGLKPTMDEAGKPHWPSRVPQTGLLLKGKGHKTWNKTVKGEEEAGYEIIQGADGRYYSFPKEEAPENPYKKEYPDAFFEDGIWKVIRDGKKYRIEE